MRFVLAALVTISGCDLYDDGYPTDTDRVIRTEDCPGEPIERADSLTLSGTTLTVSASYPGCEATRMWLCWDGIIGGGGPNPYAKGFDLHHKPAGDCDAIHSTTESFSIASEIGSFTSLTIYVGGRSVIWETEPPQ